MPLKSDDPMCYKGSIHERYNFFWEVLWSSGNLTLYSLFHRMIGVGRDLWGTSSSTALPKQGHLEQAAQDLVQEGLE